MASPTLPPSSNSAVASPPHDAWGWWWERARRTAQQLSAGIAPPTIEVWGPVLEPDEKAVLTAEVNYARLYGGDGRYEPTSTFLFGRPALMMGSLAVTAAVNHRRKAVARRDAIPCWRDVQHASIIVTTQRLLAATDAGWESAWWAAVTEMQPDLASWSLMLGFGAHYSPIRLVGPAVPALSVWAAAGVLGRQWSADPRLLALLVQRRV
ncbi:MAG: hypothetical protein QG597_2272 [Actinomycetota bacterium]|nr:hypothetical protein [Actinomycetota bacterium]